MKVFLLAAGKGSRISKNIPDIPKCTLPIDGKPLILRTVEMLLKHQAEITIIVGYRYQRIVEILKDMPVNIVYNPFFDVTNSIASLWLAKTYMTDEDTIIANADVFWVEGLYEFIKKQTRDVFLLSDVKHVLDGDYFFGTEDGVILRYGKELTLEERTCEYVGIAYISASVMPAFRTRLNEMIEHQHHSVWWENVLYDMTKDREIYAIDVEGRFWAEVDFIEDYQKIEKYVEEHRE